MDVHSNKTERFSAPRRSIKERFAAGKALRAQVSRESHGQYQTSAKRRDPIAVLKEQARTRVPNLVPIRHARMLTSPFAFLRGTAAIMAGDLAFSPTTGLMVQACGDMHVANIGLYASAERNLVLAINDFDETQIGPWEWDLKRLATSALVAMEFIGGGAIEQAAAAKMVARSYREKIREYGKMGFLDVWYSTIDEQQVLAAFSEQDHHRIEEVFAKARKRNHLQVLAKMTELIDNQYHIIENKPLVVRETHADDGTPIKEKLELLLESYLESLPLDRRQLVSRYRVIDVARKVVGVGSVGTRCWVILLAGADDGDPLFLQVKEANPSALSPYWSLPVSNDNQGFRVVSGQRLIQGSPDIFLGWCEVNGKHFYVRQLRDMKGSVSIQPGETDPPHFLDYCRLCGWALALAHAKSGDAAMIGGYLGKSEAMDEAITAFAKAYAEQNAQDYAAMRAAAKNGEIPVANLNN